MAFCENFSTWNVTECYHMLEGESILRSDYVFAVLKTLSVILYGGPLEEGKKPICPFITKNDNSFLPISLCLGRRCCCWFLALYFANRSSGCRWIFICSRDARQRCKAEGTGLSVVDDLSSLLYTI